MARPWKTIECVETPDGSLELRRQGEDDFLITIAGRVLMNSRANRSEIALAAKACAALAASEGPHLLIGGLGMGCTLRAALDALPTDAEVEVCEINEAITRWCRGPLRGVNGAALEDPRVRIETSDVSKYIAGCAADASHARYDAILLDLYEGPHARTDARSDPFYGERALAHTRTALASGGLFGVWSEAPDDAFERRLESAGFEVERLRPGRGGLRHNIYLASLPG